MSKRETKIIKLLATGILITLVVLVAILVYDKFVPPQVEPMTAHECLLAITALELFQEDAIYEAPTYDEFTKAMEWKATSLGLLITNEGYECP